MNVAPCLGPEEAAVTWPPWARAMVSPGAAARAPKRCRVLADDQQDRGPPWVEDKMLRSGVGDARFSPIGRRSEGR